MGEHMGVYTAVRWVADVSVVALTGLAFLTFMNH